MNKKIDLLVDEPCPELLCGICLDVLEDPIQVHCPEDHMFCSKCIQSHVEKQSNCPLCLTALDKTSFQLSKFVQRQISRLRIKCLHADNGCPWKGYFSDDHISTCTFKPCACPNAEKGCTVKNLNNQNMQHHLKACLYQTMSCPNNMPLCQPFLLKDLSIHESECQSYTCPYASEGCPFIGTLSQANVHRDNYCGQLHQKINSLEDEVKKLNKLIQDITIGLNIKLPPTPETMTEDKKQQQDATMNEIDLFHQILNNDAFAPLDLASSNTSIVEKLAGPTATTNEMMDLSSCLTDISFLDDKDAKTNDIVDLNSIFESATSPQPLQFIPPLNTPKRTSNGRKIRYSKNKRLAHNAMRMARQRTASNNNPTNDAILNNLDIAKQKLAFKNINDVTEFLNTDTTNKSSPKLNPAKKEKKKSPSTDTASGPKRRPMFILASSYLSNYNNSNTNDK